MKLSHLNALRALEATLRCGTFSAAADELGVTVGAIGQQLRGLEDYLGLRLFDRLPSGVRPTVEAREVAEQLTMGFGAVDEALAQLRGGRDGRHLTISLTYHYLDHWLSNRLTSFYGAYPDIEIKIEASDALVDLRAENIDMAIRFSRDAGQGFDALEICHGCYLPVCTPGFAEVHGITPETRDLTGVPLFILYDRTTDPEWRDWAAWMKDFGLTSTDPFGGQHTTGQNTAVSGAGLVLTGLTEVFNDMREGRLVAPLGPRVMRRGSYMYRVIWPKTRRPNRAMRAFLAWIAAERDEFVAEASALLGVQLN